MKKYLVASSGDTLDSKVSGRFGHSGYFLLIDPLTMEFEILNIKKVIVGNIGPSSYNEVLSYGCKVYLCRNMSVSDAVRKVKNDEVPLLKEPTLKDSIHSARKTDEGDVDSGRGEGRGSGKGSGSGPRDGSGRGMGGGMGGGMRRGISGGMGREKRGRGR